ncbi:hypothetical protein CEXT_582421, partial [Caerostris extrusa]
TIDDRKLVNLKGLLTREILDKTDV